MGIHAQIDSNVASATKLAAAKNINGVPFDGSADITINAIDNTSRVASSLLGAVNGVATLDANGLVPSAQLPSYVDDVLEYVNLASFPAAGSSGKIYIALDTNKTYRWSGSVYVAITAGSVDSVTGTAPVVSSGGTAPIISIPAATATINGYMTKTYAAKLDSISSSANYYVLPIATSTVKGGVELFSDTVQAVAANAITATASRTYGVQLNTDGQAVVNIPWIDPTTTVNNTLVSTNTTLALSAAQGKVLQDTKEPVITTLAVNKGGTGVGTLTGLVKGNGTEAFTTAVAGTDYQAPLVSGVTIKSVNGTSLLIGGDLNVVPSLRNWRDVKASRAIGTVYTNSTMQPINVSISVYSTNTSAKNSAFLYCTDAGTAWVVVGACDLADYYSASSLVSTMNQLTAVIPPRKSYYIAQSGTGMVVSYWTELAV